MGTGVLALLLLTTGLVAALATPAQAGSTPVCVAYAGTVTYTTNATGSSTWTVPAGVTNVTFDVPVARVGSVGAATSTHGPGNPAVKAAMCRPRWR